MVISEYLKYHLKITIKILKLRYDILSFPAFGTVLFITVLVKYILFITVLINCIETSVPRVTIWHHEAC